MNLNKYKIILVMSIAVLAYFFIAHFSLIRKWVGHDTPEPKKSKILIPNGQNSLSSLSINAGFKINVFAAGLEDPNVISFDAMGRMLISETTTGKVILLEDKDKNGVAETNQTILDNLNKPHGLTFYNSGNTTYLYVAETQQVARYRYDVTGGAVISTKGQNIVDLPAGGQHFTRTIAFGPNYRKEQIIKGQSQVNTLVNTKLYTSVGSSCDVCEEQTWKRAAILESDPGGNFTAEFAGGLRNSVFFAFHPKTKEIWATEMGRDGLGNNLPPDEINIVKVAGPEDKFGAKRYGWPFCYGDKVRDKVFNPDKIQRIDISADCSKTESPVIQIPAHSVPLGLAFIPANSGWPKEWEGDLLVALHGSGNASVPVGYKVVRYDLDTDGKVLSQKPEDFISGWLSENGKILGQPVDLRFGPNSTLYISDDSAGIIYRVIPK